MSLTLLLDLDDTLLDSSMDTFLPAYFEALSAYVSDQVDPGNFIEALMVGTRAMMANTDPALTLKQVFNAAFFPRLEVEPHAL